MKGFKSFVDHPDPRSLIDKSESQAGQDLFVICMLQGKHDGTFLEIGGDHPRVENNTYLLEKEFGFSGTSIDLFDIKERWWNSFYNKIKKPHWSTDAKWFEDLPLPDEFKDIFDAFVPTVWQDRPLTRFIKGDALEIDYSWLPERIDYLQIDIEPPLNNLRMLEKLLPRSRFSVVTFEHDYWLQTNESVHARQRSRELMKEFGYIMIANDVTVEPGRGNLRLSYDPLFFEDWYVDPATVPQNIIAAYQNITVDLSPKYYTHILFN